MNRALVCIPTYNERGQPRAHRPAVLAADPRVDILVVDDNSPGRHRAARRRAGREGAAHQRAPPREEGGPGPRVPGRLPLGARRARYTYILEMDADFSHDPRYLPDAAGRAPRRGADLVLGSRYVAGGGTVNWGVGRQIISRGGSLYARTILGRATCATSPAASSASTAAVLEAIDLDDGAEHRLRVPDRAHLPDAQEGLHGGGGAHRLRGPPRRAVEDEPEDLPRGARPWSGSCGSRCDAMASLPRPTSSCRCPPSSSWWTRSAWCRSSSR